MSNRDCRRVDHAMGQHLNEAGVKAARTSYWLQIAERSKRVKSASSDADRRLRMLAEIIGPLTQSLGANYEIVLHDYRIPDRSVLPSPAR